MNCNEIEFLMPLYLTSELEATRLAEFEQHLRRCSVCATNLENVRHYDDLLRDAFEAQPLNTEKLRQRVSSQVRKAARRRFLFARPVYSLPIAAALLLVITTVIYTVLSGGLSQTVYAAAQHDHYIEVVQQEDRPWLQTPEEIRAFVRDELGEANFLDQLTPDGYHLARALHCYLLKERYVHLVYQNGSREISVFVRPREAELTGSPVEIVNGCGLYAAAVRKFEIAGFQSQKYRVLVVSDLSRGESLQIARTAAAVITK